MVCANITFRMLLGMAINLSTLPNVAGWLTLHSSSGVNVSLISLLRSAAGTQCLLANSSLIWGGSLQTEKVTEDMIKLTHWQFWLLVKVFVFSFPFFPSPRFFVFVCFNVCQNFWEFLRLCYYFF